MVKEVEALERHLGAGKIIVEPGLQPSILPCSHHLGG